MTNEEYIGAQNALQRIGKEIENHDWNAFVQRADRAETVGSMMDPTLYMKAAGVLAQLKAIGFDLGALKHKYAKLKEEVEKKNRSLV